MASFSNGLQINSRYKQGRTKGTTFNKLPIIGAKDGRNQYSKMDTQINQKPADNTQRCHLFTESPEFCPVPRITEICVSLYVFYMRDQYETEFGLKSVFH